MDWNSATKLLAGEYQKRFGKTPDTEQVQSILLAYGTRIAFDVLAGFDDKRVSGLRKPEVIYLAEMEDMITRVLNVGVSVQATPNVYRTELLLDELREERKQKGDGSSAIQQLRAAGILPSQETEQAPKPRTVPRLSGDELRAALEAM